MTATLSIYRSLFLSPDAPHQKYFGWRVAFEDVGVRILTRTYGPVRRTLVLLSAQASATFEDALSRSGALAGLVDVYVHDFDRVLDAQASFAGSRFAPTHMNERLLNTATIVVDLSREESAILADMTSDYRRKIRKAVEGGVVITAHERPHPAMIADFIVQYTNMARSRGFNTIQHEMLARMYESGDAVLFTAEARGEIGNYLHVYRTAETGLFMYGVNRRKLNDGAGQVLHWQAMRWLKARNVRWYDLGGVASTDPGDGIFVFKQRFGGAYIDLGQELRRRAPMLQAAAAIQRKLRG